MASSHSSIISAHSSLYSLNKSQWSLLRSFTHPNRKNNINRSLIIKGLPEEWSSLDDEEIVQKLQNEKVEISILEK